MEVSFWRGLMTCFVSQLFTTELVSLPKPSPELLALLLVIITSCLLHTSLPVTLCCFFMFLSPLLFWHSCDCLQRRLRADRNRYLRPAPRSLNGLACHSVTRQTFILLIVPPLPASAESHDAPGRGRGLWSVQLLWLAACWHDLSRFRKSIRGVEVMS